MPSADFCPITPNVAVRRAARVAVGVRWCIHCFRAGPQSGSRGDHSPRRVRWRFQPFRDRASVRLPSRHGPLVEQISPDKNVNFPCTTAAFTLSPAPGGLCHLVLTRPGTGPSMRFLSVGSHVCARASSRQPLARLPLPSASSFICPLGHTGTPTGDFHPTSSRPCRAYTTRIKPTPHGKACGFPARRGLSAAPLGDKLTQSGDNRWQQCTAIFANVLLRQSG